MRAHSSTAYRIIMSKSVAKGMKSITAVADFLGYSRQTMSNKLDKPRTITILELADMARYLNLTDEEIAQIVRASRNEIHKEQGVFTEGVWGM